MVNVSPDCIGEELLTFTFDPRSIVIKNFQKFEGGRMVTYGYSILMNPDGTESERTEPQAMSSIGFDDGSPFTEDKYNSIVGKRPREKKWWERLWKW